MSLKYLNGFFWCTLLALFSFPLVGHANATDRDLPRYHAGILIKATSRLNVRIDPSQTAKVIHKLNRGEVVLILNYTPLHDEYVRVLTRDGLIGWVHKGYADVWDPKLHDHGYI